MRRKKHLSERLSAVGDYVIVSEERGFYYDPARDRPCRMDLKSIFCDHPVELEIGCGKGLFIDRMAECNRDTAFLAVERISNVIVCAAERAKGNGRDNVRFLNVSAENLLYWLPPHGIRAIYLNFSCPYPKKSYANHRLTHPKFLKIYRELLTDDGKIFQKTDNPAFFAYSLSMYAENGYRIDDRTNDLYRSDILNIPTEYEEKFVRAGKPIYYAEISLKKDDSNA